MFGLLPPPPPPPFEPQMALLARLLMISIEFYTPSKGIFVLLTLIYVSKIPYTED